MSLDHFSSLTINEDDKDRGNGKNTSTVRVLQEKCKELETMVKKYEDNMNHLKVALTKAKCENTQLRKNLDCQEMKSSSGTCSTSNTTATSFPPELWEKILDNISEAQDFSNCLQVSTTWRDLLAPKKAALLFPEVLLCLAKYLGRSGILNCRRICRQWKNSTDKYLQNHASHFRVTSLWNYEIDTKMHWLKHIYQFGRSQDVDVFFQHLQPLTPRNPFITRCIYIQDDYTCVHQCEAFWEKLSHILELFGSHVWYCSVVIDSPTLQTFRYSKLHRALALMPNLKTLWIYSSHLIQMQMRENSEVVSVRQWDHNNIRMN